MSNVRYALIEVASLLRDLATLAIGIETSEKIAQAWNWAAGLVQLLLLLLCTAIEEYGPVVGAAAGRLCGRVYAAGRAARNYYETFLSEPVAEVIVVTYELLKIGEYRATKFASEQLGTGYPEVRDFVSPFQLRIYEAEA
jgi:hypothetical protein